MNVPTTGKTWNPAEDENGCSPMLGIVARRPVFATGRGRLVEFSRVDAKRSMVDKQFCRHIVDEVSDFCHVAVRVILGAGQVNAQG